MGAEKNTRCLRLQCETGVKPALVWESRRSSADLLGRERRFARWMLGSAVRNPRCLSFTSVPARLPRLRVRSTTTDAKHFSNSGDFW